MSEVKKGALEHLQPMATDGYVLADTRTPIERTRAADPHGSPTSARASTRRPT